MPFAHQEDGIIKCSSANLFKIPFPNDKVKDSIFCSRFTGCAGRTDQSHWIMVKGLDFLLRQGRTCEILEIS